MRSFDRFFKEGDKQKEVVEGKVVSVNPFRRVIIETPTGLIKAKGYSSTYYPRRAVIANVGGKQCKFNILTFYSKEND